MNEKRCNLGGVCICQDKIRPEMCTFPYHCNYQEFQGNTEFDYLEEDYEEHL